MAKPALALALETDYRSGLERKGAEQLRREGIEFDYEKLVVEYTKPSRVARYITDFVPRGTNIVLEYKGVFGHRGRGGAEERQKYVLVQEQHPELDIRFVFQNAKRPIYKGSKTTYAKWADDHGFPWADKGTVPAAWIKEMKRA